MKRLVRHPLVQALLARVAGLYLGFALATTHWQLDGEEHLAALLAGEPHVVAFWHERLALMAPLWLRVRRLSGRPRRVYLLISLHRDGRLLAVLARRFGADVVLGSSSRGGAAGVRRLLELVRDGGLVGITPDGPRGPRRQAAPGVAQLAALAGVPILPCAAQTSRRFVLRSWDRMVIPRPFGRGVLVCRPAIAVAREGWRDAAPLIGEALTAAAEHADRLCPT